MKPNPPAAPTWRDELHLLARPAAILLACVLGAAVALGASNWYRGRAEAALAQAQLARTASAARFHNVETDKLELTRYAPRFAQLQASGMIGDENRLAWIETIRQIQTSRKLVSASFEIEPQQAVASPVPLNYGDYQLRGSRMHLELGMVHELDLFNFIDDLRAAGLFTVQDCRIRRNDIPAEAVGLARLNASCTLVWLTLGAAPQAPAPPLNKGWQ